MLYLRLTRVHRRVPVFAADVSIGCSTDGRAIYLFIFNLAIHTAYDIAHTSSHDRALVRDAGMGATPLLHCSIFVCLT